MASEWLIMVYDVVFLWLLGFAARSTALHLLWAWLPRPLPNYPGTLQCIDRDSVRSIP